MTPEETAAEIARLEALARSRDGIIGYGQNVKAIQARIEVLKQPEVPPIG
jgi:hypothetical protein